MNSKHKGILAYYKGQYVNTVSTLGLHWKWESKGLLLRVTLVENKLKMYYNLETNRIDEQIFAVCAITWLSRIYDPIRDKLKLNISQGATDIRKTFKWMVRSLNEMESNLIMIKYSIADAISTYYFVFLKSIANMIPPSR